MPDESISEYELRQQEEAEYASYLATMEGERYETEGQAIGESRTPAKAAETMDKAK